MADTRSIDLEIEVPGTPQQVWDAIATGPGITAWFVPTEIEPHEGGVVRQRFGPGEEMQVEGRVRVWDPPSRFVFAGGEGSGEGEGGAMAFEFHVAARTGGTCLVRLVNSGFGSGDEWDSQYDGMEAGWRLFLRNLRLHLTHFAGQPAVPILPTAGATGGRDKVWADLAAGLDVPATPAVGDRIEAAADDVPPLAGTVDAAAPGMVALMLDAPAPGTAFLAVEGSGDAVTISVWLYLYGSEAAAIAARDEPRWRSWMEARFPAA